MSSDWTGLSEKEARDAAADFVARVHADDASEGDWLDLEVWLSAEVAHRRAYDRAEALWFELDEVRAAIVPGLADDVPVANVVDLPARLRRKAPGPLRWAAAAAVVALALSGTLLLTSQKPETFTTKAGETISLALNDGTRINLNGSSKLSVRMDRNTRRVVMGDAEAAFDVAADANRPFLIEVGDREIRVVGTEFNVGRHDQRTVVTVRRGVVEVRPLKGDNGQPHARLTPGSQLVAVDGEQATLVHAVDTEAAFAWRSGRLIYADAPIANVAADLSRRFSKPIRVAPDAARVRFSGVLVLDSENAVLTRLQALSPIVATDEPTEIILRSAHD